MRYNGEVHRVTGFDGPIVLLLDPSGHPWRTEVSVLFELPGTRVLDAGEDTDALPPLAGADHTVLDRAPAKVLEEARMRLAHLREARFGYRGGHREYALEGEPRAEYDPSLPQMQRWGNKARELGVGVSTLRRQWREYCRSGEKAGLEALIDRRWLQPRFTAERLDPRAREAVDAVLAQELLRSRTSLTRCRAEVRRFLKKNHGRDIVPLPSRDDFNAVLHELADPMGLFHLSKKTQRSIASRPKSTHGPKVVADRPGGRVLLDISRLDVFAFDPIAGQWMNLDLALAIDQCTRSIVAMRLFPVGGSAIDVTLLLHDMVYPRRMRPGWPDEARWRYHGIPDELVYELKKSTPGEGELAGIPPVRPGCVVIDHGLVFRSWTFENGCERLGCDIEPAREFTATDKDFVERVFRTFREAVLMNLPGYKGPDVFSRARDVESGAFLFSHEILEFLWGYVATVYQRTPHGGLRLPMLPKTLLSPNQAFDEAIAREGFLYVPPAADTYYALLPVEAVKVHHYGVHANGLVYDGAGLRRYRNRGSGLGGRFGNDWPISRDPRDLSRVFFYDRDEGIWHELRWKGDRKVRRPFDEATLAYAKRLVWDNTGLPPSKNPDVLESFIHQLLDRIEHLETLTDAERRAMGTAMLRQQQAAADQPNTASQAEKPDACKPVSMVSELFDPLDEEMNAGRAEFTELNEDMESYDEDVDVEEDVPWPMVR